jgi:hypothetical protein
MATKMDNTMEMHVIKRNGDLEDLSFDKILNNNGKPTDNIKINDKKNIGFIYINYIY